MTATRNLIDAISSKDATAIESAFNVAMADKISGQLETMRQEVAHNMFKTAQEAAVATEE
jgi:hypothetical protein